MSGTQTFCLFDTQFTILVDGQQTDAAYDLVEGRYPAGSETHLHLHSRYSELIYVLEGEITVYTATGEATLRQGDHVLVPPYTSHVVAACGNTVNRALTIAAPSGLSALIRAVGISKDSVAGCPFSATDIASFLEFSARLGDMILGSPGARPKLTTSVPPG